MITFLELLLETLLLIIKTERRIKSFVDEKILDYMIDYLINSLFCFRNARCPYCRQGIKSYMRLRSYNVFRFDYLKDITEPKIFTFGKKINKLFAASATVVL